MIYRLSAGHQYHPGYLCHLWHVPTQEPDYVPISITPITKSKMKDSCMLRDLTAHHQRGEAISFISVLQLSLYLISGFSVCFHMPPKFHNSGALCCSTASTYQHIRLEGAKRLLNLTFSGTLKHKRLLSHSLCRMALVWSCIKQKTSKS